MSGATLFEPLQLGGLTLPNRIIMAPLTRMRARMPGNVPWELNAEYYRQRASAGFREVRVIHGRGRGVQRGIVQATLDRLPDVEEFCDDTASQLGATLVRLRAMP